MTLIATVRALQQLYIAHLPEKEPGPLTNSARFCLEMVNTGPDMLAVLSMFRKGDAKRLADVIEIIDFSLPSELMSVEEGDEELDFVEDEFKELVKAKSILYRLQAACTLMEADQK